MLPALPSSSKEYLNNQLETNLTQKRSSSMIFRIEHLLPSSATAPSSSEIESKFPVQYLTDYQQLPKKRRSSHCGIIASQMIQKNSRSEVFSTSNLMSTPLVIGNSGADIVEYCDTEPGGYMRCATSTSWIRKIKLSEDIHSYNILIEMSCDSVYVRAIKEISRGEELVAWFSEEVSVLMAIPFLTPLNIQGNNRYTCHVCNMSFETPNPLKIHLSLACGRHSIDILWIRLHYAVKATSLTQQLRQHELLLSPAHPMPTTYSRTTSTHSSPQQRVSAFKPINTAATNVTPRPHPLLLTPTPPQPVSLLQHSAVSLNAAAQIEAIVSNMGASKQGHLCIYCGKVYSRKYGLKIHIRTHTGFKPLKCKYCLRPFGDPSNLNKHVRLHLQTSAGDHSGTYKCTLCNKSLARRRDLQRHIESRHTSLHESEIK